MGMLPVEKKRNTVLYTTLHTAGALVIFFILPLKQPESATVHTEELPNVSDRRYHISARAFFIISQVLHMHRICRSVFYAKHISSV